MANIGSKEINSIYVGDKKVVQIVCNSKRLFGETFVVTFVSNSKTINTQTVYSGNYATTPSDPTKTGYTFNGWTVDDKIVDVSTYEITADTTFTASFTINTYTVTFVSNGSIISTQTVNYSSHATAPSNPSKSGYVFVGWSFNPSDTDGSNTETISSYNVAYDCTFYAIFVDSSTTYTATFVVDSSTISTQTITVGNYATAPDTPTKTGYVFLYWLAVSTVGSTTVTDVSTFAITYDVTFTAKFRLATVYV